MDMVIKEINPRENDNGNVMNVSVRIWISASDSSWNILDIMTFIDKSVSSMEEIRRLAFEQCYQLAEKLLANRPAQPSLPSSQCNAE